MGLGMGEVILILVIALVVFGPRKLPELGKSLGQAMSQFRRASEDFKRTWEQEVDLEKVRKTEPATGDASGESNYNYNDPYDPYGSYSGESNDNGASDSADESKSTGTSSTQEQTSDGTAATDTAAAATAQPEQKHWI